MKTSFERANDYRLRAEELRAVAESMREPDAQTVLLHIAADYDRMADKVTQIWRGLAPEPSAVGAAPSSW